MLVGDIANIESELQQGHCCLNSENKNQNLEMFTCSAVNFDFYDFYKYLSGMKFMERYFLEESM